jgi:outer membrane protein insertion porin family
MALPLARSGVGAALAAVLLLLAGGGVAHPQPNVIADIRVEGARYLSADGIIVEIGKTLKVGDPFNPEAPEDQEKLERARRAVMELGAFESVQAAVQRGDTGVALVFSVVEKQRIERIAFVGNTIFTDDQLLDVIVSRPGQIADNGTIRRDATRIEDFYKDGRRLARVVDPLVVDRFGVLTFIISEAVIEDVIFEGRKKTKLSYLKPVIRVKPGEVYDGKAVERDALALLNLGVFDDVKVNFRQGVKDPERGVIIVFVVKEKHTGLASFGAGYSSIDQFVGVFTLSESNFRGRGERVSATVEIGGRQSYEVGFFEPRLDSHGTTVELNVFNTERRRQFMPGANLTTTDSEFDERREGFNLTTGRPIGRRLRASLRLRQEAISDPAFQVARVIAPAPGPPEPGAIRTPSSGGRHPTPPDPKMPPDKAEPGETPLPIVVYAPLADVNLSSVTLGLTRDTRDLLFSPTRGYYASLFLEQAGVLGGDSNFTKASVDLRRYVKISRKKHVIAFRLAGGTTIGEVPLVESFSAGGAYTIRGYREDRFRGKNMIIGSAEYRHPITKSVTGVAFIDAGDAFGGNFPTKVPGFLIPAEDQEFRLNVGYGVGIRLAIQSLGTLRLDWGKGSEGSEVHFSFGEAF